MEFLASLDQISKSFSHGNLFKELSFGIKAGEKWGVLGSNGSGKSTFLKILAKELEADDGKSIHKKGLRYGFVHQMPSFDESLNPRDWLSKETDYLGLADFEKEAEISRVLGLSGLQDENGLIGTLSGGQKKRLAIAKELILKPELLLLDEPTNHLDIHGILWLEKLIKRSQVAAIIISHDRYFLENTCNHMIEFGKVYQNGALKISGGFEKFLSKKSEYFRELENLEQSLKSKLRREDEWLSRGAKARTSKAKYRIDQAEVIRNDLTKLKDSKKTTKLNLDFKSSDRKTKILLETEKISKSYEEKVLFKDLDLKLSPKLKLGLVGPNGSGKTTLLKLLLGNVEPDQGSLFKAENLKTVYFDQEKKQLNENENLKEALTPHEDRVIFNNRVWHVAAWAEKFGFERSRLHQKVSSLSGGEKARLLISRLMLEESDILLLDEPTNDLDIDTIEILEESLEDFNGCLIMISHDRALLDKVCNKVLALDPPDIPILFADYHQWLEYLDKKESHREKEKRQQKAPATTNHEKPKKLGYKAQRELDQTMELISKTEQEIESLELKTTTQEVISDPEKLQETCSQLQEKMDLLESLFEKWEELES